MELDSLKLNIGGVEYDIEYSSQSLTDSEYIADSEENRSPNSQIYSPVQSKSLAGSNKSSPLVSKSSPHLTQLDASIDRDMTEQENIEDSRQDETDINQEDLSGEDGYLITVAGSSDGQQFRATDGDDSSLFNIGEEEDDEKQNEVVYN